jgi:hypothetical protein
VAGKGDLWRDPFELAKSFTAEQIAGLKEAGGEQRKFGRLMERLVQKEVGGVSGERRDKIKGRAFELLMNMGGEETEVTRMAGTTPTGPEAERLGKGEKAVGAAQAEFTTIMQKFGPSIKSFNDASLTYIKAAQELKEAAPLIKSAVESK